MSKKEFMVGVEPIAYERLQKVAESRGVPVKELAEAYIEDWLSIEYAELVGRRSRRAIYRDGPLAFDPQAREANRRIEEDIQRGLPS
jgi:hypothetical protein